MSSFAPRILISSMRPDPESAANYVAAVRAAGGEPVVRFAPAVDLDFDGLLLSGGGDIDPALYGRTPDGSNPPDPRRDESELPLCRAFLDAGKPILGICRGHQVINVVLGGTMIQDMGEELNFFHRRPDTQSPDRIHAVRADPGSILGRLYGTQTPFSVNSSHHQALDTLGEGLVVTARSEHGIVESVELPGRPLLGVQFHPERLTGAKAVPGCVDGGAIFRWLVDACRA